MAAIALFVQTMTTLVQALAQFGTRLLQALTRFFQLLAAFQRRLQPGSRLADLRLAMLHLLAEFGQFDTQVLLALPILVQPCLPGLELGVQSR